MTFQAPDRHLPVGPTPPPRVRAVLFDLDGTLYRQAPLRALMALELATLPLSGPSRAPARLRALQAYRRAQERLRHQDRQTSDRAQLEAAAEASGLPVAEVEDVIADWMHQRPLKYLHFCRRPGLEALLTTLDTAGIRAGVLSDYPAGEKLRALGVEGRFSPVLCSTDAAIGAFKPNPRGYLHACDTWGLAPSEVLYIGDRPEVDAAGAAAAGMRCAIVGRSPAPPNATYAVIASLREVESCL